MGIVGQDMVYYRFYVFFWMKMQAYGGKMGYITDTLGELQGKTCRMKHGDVLLLLHRETGFIVK
jgi:hypothetical protein